MSIFLRAARYVGAESEPRCSVMVGRDKVLLFVGTRYGLLYSEESGQPRGIHFNLTPRRAAAIRDALSDD